VRNELVRSLIDLLGRSRADRLVAARDLLGRAMTLSRALEPDPAAITEAPKRRGKGRAGALEPATAASAPAGDGSAGEPADADSTGDAGAGGAKASAAERRRALALLLDLWRDVARDLACIQRGAGDSVRDVALLEELTRAAGDLEPGSAAVALARLVRAGELLEVNATPELVLDVLLVRWPRRVRAA